MNIILVFNKKSKSDGSQSERNQSERTRLILNISGCIGIIYNVRGRSDKITLV